MNSTDTTINLAPVLQIVWQVAGIVVTALISFYVPRLIRAFECQTGVQLTAQQQDEITKVVLAAAGTVETRIDQKLMTIADVHAANPAIAVLANEAINGVKATAEELGVTPEMVARQIVGAVDTRSRVPTPPVT